jgi:tetratricopeptide (TPR) repeat protein
MFGKFKRPQQEGAKVQPPQEQPAPTPAPSQPAPTPVVKAYDPYGREVQIPRDIWKTRVLPGQIQQAWNNADALYQVLASACVNGFYEEALEPSLQLLKIDSVIERSHVLRSIVMLNTGRLMSAEGILKQAIAKIGETGTILMHMAKAQAAQEGGEAEKTLWRSLELDPNQSAALPWWITLQKERRGKEIEEQALNEAANISGSWRPQMLLARLHLERENLAKALPLYETVLATAPRESDAMIQISSDLGQKDHPREAIRLVAPIYDPAKHDPRTGVNLLQAYWDTQNFDASEALLESLYRLGNPGLTAVLQRYSAQIDAVRVKAEGRAAIQGSAPSLALALFEKPIWMPSAGDAIWLAGTRPRGKKVLFLALTAPRSESDQATTGTEDDMGRISRGFPLYIAELLYCRSNVDARVMVPTTTDGSLVLLGGAESEEQLQHIAEGYDLLASGTIRREESKLSVSITLRSAADLQPCAVFERTFSPEEVGAAAMALAEGTLEYLSSLANVDRETPLSYYQAPSPEHANHYIAGLNQLMVLLLTQPEHRAKLAGERNILLWLQNLAVNIPANEAMQFMFFIALAKAKNFGSTIFREFERTAFAKINDLAREKRFSARLAPLVYATFGRPQEFEMAATGTFALEPGYGEWCDRLASSVLNGAPRS